MLQHYIFEELEKARSTTADATNYFAYLKGLRRWALREVIVLKSMSFLDSYKRIGYRNSQGERRQVGFNSPILVKFNFNNFKQRRPPWVIEI
jgi:hypothetical protein